MFDHTIVTSYDIFANLDFLWLRLLLCFLWRIVLLASMSFQTCVNHAFNIFLVRLSPYPRLFIFIWKEAPIILYWFHLGYSEHWHLFFQYKVLAVLLFLFARELLLLSPGGDPLEDLLHLKDLTTVVNWFIFNQGRRGAAFTSCMLSDDQIVL